MIDPRISLAVQVPQVSQAISIYENALMNSTNRDLARSQDARAATQANLQNQVTQNNINNQPLQNELLQQTVDGNQLQLDQARDNKRLVSIADFATKLIPQLEADIAAGDTTKTQVALTNRLSMLEAAKANDPELDSTETQEGLALLKQNPKELLGMLNSYVDLARTKGLYGAGSNAVQSSQFIPGKGFATLTKDGRAGLVEVENVGETTEQKRTADLNKTVTVEKEKARLSGKTSAIKAAVAKGSQVFDKIQPLTTAIANYDEAIAAIDSGAQTGVIQSMLPSFKKASIELDNVVKRLGLDVVGNTTFGALSESELAFALKAAIPDNLKPADLKEWLIAKKNAQQKVKARVEEAAQFLSDGTHTIKDWVEYDKARQLNQQNKPADDPLGIF